MMGRPERDDYPGQFGDIEYSVALSRYVEWLENKINELEKYNNIIGIDQYDRVYHELGSKPRKELCRQLHTKTASKIYIDNTDGVSKHVGWVVGGRWVSLYRIKAWEKDAK